MNGHADHFTEEHKTIDTVSYRDATDIGVTGNNIGDKISRRLSSRERQLQSEGGEQLPRTDISGTIYVQHTTTGRERREWDDAEHCRHGGEGVKAHKAFNDDEPNANNDKVLVGGAKDTDDIDYAQLEVYKMDINRRFGLLFNIRRYTRRIGDFGMRKISEFLSKIINHNIFKG